MILFKIQNGSSNPVLLLCLLDLIKEVLSLDDEIQKLATELYQQKSVLIMGRGYHYATCLEGALVSECNLLFNHFVFLSMF